MSEPQVGKLLGRTVLDVAGAGLFPCVGVYADVSTAGTIRAGDQVLLT